MKKSRYTNTRQIPIAILIVVILGALIANTFMTRAVSRVAITVASPFLKLSSSVESWIDNTINIVASKKKLVEENERLRKSIADREIESLSLNALQLQNEELRTLVGRGPSKHTTLAAYVIGVPPQSPYDTMLIDVGSINDIRRGMRVVTSEGIFLGTIEDVSRYFSKIRLISSPDVTTEVRIAERGIMVEAVGRGGGNFVITLPEELSPKVGDTVITPELDFFIIGTVSAIEVDVASPIQKLFLRFPISFRELSNVLVVL